MEQGATFPLEKVSMKGDAVHFEVAAVGGVYDGTLNAARTELKGMWTQSERACSALEVCVTARGGCTKDDAAAKIVGGPERETACGV